MHLHGFAVVADAHAEGADARMIAFDARKSSNSVGALEKRSDNPKLGMPAPTTARGQDEVELGSCIAVLHELTYLPF